MDYRLTAEDKERIKLLDEVTKNKFQNLSLEQLVRLQELLKKNTILLLPLIDQIIQMFLLFQARAVLTLKR